MIRIEYECFLGEGGLVRLLITSSVCSTCNGAIKINPRFWASLVEEERAAACVPVRVRCLVYVCGPLVARGRRVSGCVLLFCFVFAFGGRFWGGGIV